MPLRSWRRRASLAFALALAGWACASPAPATPPVATASPSAAPVRTGGTVVLAEVSNSGLSGTLEITPNADGSTTLSIRLSDASRPYLWRIDHQAECRSPGLNQEAAWSFADVEGGARQDQVETATFLSAPAPLLVLVLPIDRPGLLACGDLGPAMAAAASPPPVDCPANGSPAPEPGAIAYALDRFANTDIYVSRLDGSDARRLTTHPGRDFDPSWSPDGRRIAFRSTRDGHDEIYLMNADGTCQQNLTESPADSWSPAWSPDGTEIAIAHFFDGNSAHQDIGVINVDGTRLRRLTTAHGEYPAWSPDGRQLAFASFRDGNYEIYVMNADGSDQRNISRNPAYDMAPSWSPDGRSIAYDTQRDHGTPIQVGLGPEFEIHVMRPDGTDDRAITNDGLEDRFPSWLADGGLLWAKGETLWSADADGTNAHPIGAGMFPDAWP